MIRCAIGVAVDWLQGIVNPVAIAIRTTGDRRIYRIVNTVCIAVDV